jgi:hypothetical protein
MTVIVTTCASPTPLRRTVVRALTTLGLTAGAWLAISLASADANAGPIDGLSGVVQDVSDAAGQVTGGAAAAAQPVIGATADAVQPVITATAPVVREVTQAAAPAVEYVAENASPVVEVVTQVAEPVVQPVGEIVQDVTAPVLDATAPVIDSVGDIVEPVTDVVAPVVDPVVDAVTPVVDVVTPVVEPVIDPLLPVVDAVDPTSPVVDTVGAIGAPVGSVIGSTITSTLPAAASLQLSAISLLGSDPAAVAGAGAVSTGIESAGTATTVTALQSFAGYLVGAGSAPLAADTASALTESASGQIASAPTGSDVPGFGLPVPGPGPVPSGVPGCPGAAGGAGGFAGSLQIPALTPASGAGAVAFVGSTADDHFAALLCRADEPGASPD